MVQKLGSSVTPLIQAVLVGATSSEGGTVSLYTSDQKSGTYTKVSEFSSGTNGLTVQSQLPPGAWIKAGLSGSQTINDVLSPAVQLVGLLRATCTFPTTGSVGMKLAGKCSFSFALNKTPIALQTNIGSGWGNVATGSISENTISPSITPKKSGKLQVRLISPGQIGLYSSFISNISIIQIAASKKH